jgi:hypothetical protein
MNKVSSKLGHRLLATHPATEEDTHMANPPPRPDPNGDTGVGPDRGPTAGTPRWAKVFWIIAIVVVVLFAIALLTKGPHNPGRHLGSAHALPAAHAPSGGPGGAAR